MKFAKTLLASAALIASFAASAGVNGTSVNSTSGSFLTLSSTTLGPYAVTGGTVYNGDKSFASDPSEAGITVYGGTFLAAGPSSGTTASINFGAGLGFISFLWGSPDLYNQLTVTGTGGYSQVFTAGTSTGSSIGLNFLKTDGTQTFAQYVQFTATAGTMITGLSFTNIPSIDAFEAANFSVTPIPEPETYALMLAGLGAMAFVARRRKSA